MASLRLLPRSGERANCFVAFPAKQALTQRHQKKSHATPQYAGFESMVLGYTLNPKPETPNPVVLTVPRGLEPLTPDPKKP